MGTIAAHNAGSDPEELRRWIQQVRVLAPDKPFGVNFTILPSMGTPPPYEAYAQASADHQSLHPSLQRTRDLPACLTVCLTVCLTA